MSETATIHHAARYYAVRNGVSFHDCLIECIGNQDLIAGYDRLNGTNLGMHGDGLALAIDSACGRQDVEIQGFVDFCWDHIFTRFG